jgi:DNA-binding NarL/FixJ family response regulator
LLSNLAMAAGAWREIRTRTVEAREVLTPHGRKIARQADDGLSNADIASVLYLGVRTIGICTALSCRRSRHMNSSS